MGRQSLDRFPDGRGSESPVNKPLSLDASKSH